MANLTVVFTDLGTPVALPAKVNLTASDTVNTFNNDGKTFLRIGVATGQSPVTCRMDAVRELPLDVSANQTQTFSADEDDMWGPFPTTYFNNLSGQSQFTVTSGDPDDLEVSVISVRDTYN